MAKQVPWTKRILEEFIAQAMLTEIEEKIIRTRVAGWSTTKQAIEFNLSISSVNRIVSVLKAKYDAVSAYDPILPRRNVRENVYKTGGFSDAQ